MSIYMDKLERTNKEICRYAHEASAFGMQKQFKRAIEHYVWADQLIERAIMICEAGIKDDAENAGIFLAFLTLYRSMHQSAEIAIFKHTLELQAHELGEAN